MVAEGRGLVGHLEGVDVLVEAGWVDVMGMKAMGWNELRHVCDASECDGEKEARRNANGTGRRYSKH